MREAGGALNAVSCPSPQACAAVGEFSVKTNFTMAPLGASWNGTSWARQPMPAPAGASELNMTGESCPPATACAAVGTINQYFAPAPVAERWDGSQWTIQPVVAGGQRPLAERWSGTSWAIQRFSGKGRLSGMSCPAATYCAAVGNSGDHPQAQAWAGTSWASQPIRAITGARSATLVAVSCASATACAAVGSYTDRPGPSSPLAERWNGTAWARQALPVVSASTTATLLGVSCPSARACTAVGHYFDRAQHRWRMLAEAWNGSAWAIQPAPTPTGHGDDFYTPALTAVSCLTHRVHRGRPVRRPDRGRALEQPALGHPVHAEFLHHRVGPVRGVVPVRHGLRRRRHPVRHRYRHHHIAGRGLRRDHLDGPDHARTPKDGSAYLFGVSCPSASDCFAVGDADATLVEHYS